MKFEIHIANTDVTTGSIPITWCLDREALAHVKNNFDEPHVVIVVSPDCGHEKTHNPNHELRYVVPLNEGMTYVSFKRPGKTKIFGFIINGPLRQARRNVYARESMVDDDLPSFGFFYSFRVISEHCDGYHTWMQRGCPSSFDLLAPIVEMDVPSDVFAKEPSKWERSWVLWLVNDTGIDECAFRKRKIFAYTIQPFIFLVNVVLRILMVIFALLHGSRSVTLKIRPMTYSLMELREKLFKGGSVFIKDDPSFERLQSVQSFKRVCWLLLRDRQAWRLLFYPYTVAFVVLVTWANAWPIVGLTVALFVTLFAIIAVLATKVYTVAFDYCCDAFYRLMTRIGLFGAPEALQVEEQLICTGTPQLPRKKSIRLRYLALKSKVCKPYAN